MVLQCNGHCCLIFFLQVRFTKGLRSATTNYYDLILLSYLWVRNLLAGPGAVGLTLGAIVRSPPFVRSRVCVIVS